MTGILIATHGKMSEGLKDAVELIMGNQENFDTVSLYHDTDVSDFGDLIKEKIHKLDTGEGVLVFVDLFGASPFNQSVLKKQEMDNNYRIISGVNLPMLLEASSMAQSGMKPEDIYSIILTTGRDGIKDFDEEFNK